MRKLSISCFDCAQHDGRVARTFVRVSYSEHGNYETRTDVRAKQSRTKRPNYHQTCRPSS
jgi:hypothetical protein